MEMVRVFVSSSCFRFILLQFTHPEEFQDLITGKKMLEISDGVKYIINKNEYITDIVIQHSSRSTDRLIPDT